MTHIEVPFRTGGILSVAALVASLIAGKYIWAPYHTRLVEKELGAYHYPAQTYISQQGITAREKFMGQIKRDQQEEVKEEKTPEKATEAENEGDSEAALEKSSKQGNKQTDKSQKTDVNKQEKEGEKKDQKKDEANQKKGDLDQGQKKEGEKKDQKTDEANQKKGDLDQGQKKEGSKQSKGSEIGDGKVSGKIAQIASSFGGFLDSITGHGRAKVVSRKCQSGESQDTNVSDGYVASIMTKLRTIGRSLTGGSVEEHVYKIEIESPDPQNKVMGTLVETIEMEGRFSRDYPEFAFACQQGIKDVSENWFDRYMVNLTDLCEDMRGDTKEVWSKTLNKNAEEIEVLIRGENGLEIREGKLSQVPISDYSVDFSLSKDKKEESSGETLSSEVANVLEKHRRRIRLAVSPQDKELLCLLQSAWASALRDYNEVSPEACKSSPSKMPFTLKLQWKWNFVDDRK